MLEPPSPAEVPFETQQESTSTQDFEQVCVSLVERGWKIMPKKGTYPLNKQGPRYINLVDPRGNRKTIHVFEQRLWEKLRQIEFQRIQNRNSNGRKRNDPTSLEPVRQETHSSEPVVQAQPFEEIKDRVEVAQPQKLPVVLASVMKLPSTLVLPEHNVVNDDANMILETSSLAIQNFARKNADLQKSIFELGFETLLATLQGENLTTSEVRKSIQDWAGNPTTLIELVHRKQEEREERRLDELRQRIKDLSSEDQEKDKIIAKLQTELKQLKSDFLDTQRNLREL